MKIGVLVSSQIRDSVKATRRNLIFMKEAFPSSDLILGVWDYQESLAFDYIDLAKEAFIIKEPMIHYEPYIDNPKAVLNYQYQKKLKSPNERHKHQTKQILAHNRLMEHYGKEYDVIIRTRWDTVVGVTIDFLPYLKETFQEEKILSISARVDYHRKILTIGEFSSSEYPYMNHRNSKTGKIKLTKTDSHMLLDNGILIHRTEDWSTDLVRKLHESKKLLAAEFGWYQVLIGNDQTKKWKHYDGGACLSRSIIKEERQLLKKYEMLCDNDY